jgi:hypothetical protein
MDLDAPLAYRYKAAQPHGAVPAGCFFLREELLHAFVAHCFLVEILGPYLFNQGKQEGFTADDG